MLAAMDWLRIVLALFLVAHALGHLIWFLAAWTPLRAGVSEGSWLLPGEVAIRDLGGKLLGLVALVALGFLLGAAFAVLDGRESWRMVTVIGCVLSLVAVIPWWRRSPGITAFNASAADIGLLVFVALPVSAELVGA
jgi:hypothetical protein